MNANELMVLGRLLYYIRMRVYKLTRMELHNLTKIHLTQIARMERCEDHICDLSSAHVTLVRAMGIKFTDFYNVVEQMTDILNNQLHRVATVDEVDAVVAHTWVFGNKSFN